MQAWRRHLRIHVHARIHVAQQRALVRGVASDARCIIARCKAQRNAFSCRRRSLHPAAHRAALRRRVERRGAAVEVVVQIDQEREARPAVAVHVVRELAVRHAAGRTSGRSIKRTTVAQGSASPRRPMRGRGRCRRRIACSSQIAGSVLRCCESTRCVGRCTARCVGCKCQCRAAGAVPDLPGHAPSTCGRECAPGT